MAPVCLESEKCCSARMRSGVEPGTAMPVAEQQTPVSFTLLLHDLPSLAWGLALTPGARFDTSEVETGNTRK